MQLGRRGDQAEAEPAALGAAAAFGPVKALQHPLPQLLGDAGSPVGHHDAGLAGLGAQGEADLGALGRVLDGVVQKVGERLEQHVAVAADRRRAGDLEPEAAALGLGQRLVELGHVADQVRQLDRLEAALGRAGLGLGDGEQRGEGLQQLVDLGHGLGGRLAIGVEVGVLQQQQLETAAQPRQRAAQVVGDVVGDLLGGVEQALDAVQHGVEVRRHLVELVAAAAERNPPVEVAAHDLAAGGVDVLDAPEQEAAHQQRAGQRQRQDDRQAPAERLGHQVAHPGALAHVVADQEMQAAAQVEQARPAEIDRLLVLGLGKLEAEGHPAVGVRRLDRPVRDVTGQGRVVAVDQQVEAAPAGGAGGPALDRVQEAADAALMVLLGQAADLGVDGGVDLARQGIGGVPVDKAHQGEHRRAEQAEVDQREAKGSRLEQPNRCHAGSIPRLGRYARGAGRNPGRSCRAGG